RSNEICLCIGLALLGLATFMRWHSRSAADCVRLGLLAGGIPLVAGLAMSRLAPLCAELSQSTSCSVLCFSVGVPAGLWLGFRLARNGAASWTRLAAFGTATLAASLGCLELGLGGIAGATIGLGLGILPPVAANAFVSRPPRN